MKYNFLYALIKNLFRKAPYTLPKEELKKGFIYQIYVRSFKDSNNDGIGDLQGIISKLEYIKSLGTSIIWLTPIYPSSGADGGYDVSNYKAIDPVYGTIDDFKHLVKEANKLGMVIMLDMVFNHTSFKHKWFKKALKKHKRYENYYIFRRSDKEGVPPNNIISKFGGNAWEYVKERDDWYLHLFSKEQPDLNWANPRVRKELIGVLKFWMKLGVGGFRFDVINLVSKRPFEEYKGGDGREIYTDGPMMHTYLKELHNECFTLFKDGKFKDIKIFAVGEMSSPNLHECAKYTNPSSNELDSVFVFKHLKSDYVDGKKFARREFNVRAFNDVLDEMFLVTNKGGGMLSFVLECHDQERIISRLCNNEIFNDEKYRKEASKVCLGLNICLPGIPGIYQGQEIGMTNMHFTSLSQIDDVESKNAINKLRVEGKSDTEILEIINSSSRDHARTTMQFSCAPNGGFSTYTRCSDETIMQGGVFVPRTNPNYTNINVKRDLKYNDSIIMFLKKLLYLKRNYKALYNGNYIPMRLHDSVIAFKRSYKEQSVIYIGNFSSSTLVINEDFDSYKVILGNYEDSNVNQVKRGTTLRAYEMIILLKK